MEQPGTSLFVQVFLVVNPRARLSNNISIIYFATSGIFFQKGSHPKGVSTLFTPTT
jgi:hypothetical protein